MKFKDIELASRISEEQPALETVLNFYRTVERLIKVKVEDNRDV